jgi:hypothetical protein
MRTKLVLVEPPMFKSFTMFGKPDFELLKQSKTIRVSFDKVTMKRVSTNIQFGDCQVKVNLPIKGYELFEHNEFNFFTNEQSTSYLFLISKKQNDEVYKKYVVDLVKLVLKNYFKIKLDKLTIELEFARFYY